MKEVSKEVSPLRNEEVGPEDGLLYLGDLKCFIIFTGDDQAFIGDLSAPLLLIEVQLPQPSGEEVFLGFQ